VQFNVTLPEFSEPKILPSGMSLTFYDTDAPMQTSVQTQSQTSKVSNLLKESEEVEENDLKQTQQGDETPDLLPGGLRKGVVSKKDLRKSDLLGQTWISLDTERKLLEFEGQGSEVFYRKPKWYHIVY